MSICRSFGSVLQLRSDKCNCQCFPLNAILTPKIEKAHSAGDRNHNRKSSVGRRQGHDVLKAQDRKSSFGGRHEPPSKKLIRQGGRDSCRHLDVALKTIATSALGRGQGHDVWKTQDRKKIFYVFSASRSLDRKFMDRYI